jgi:hypothetical protein
MQLARRLWDGARGHNAQALPERTTGSPTAAPAASTSGAAASATRPSSTAAANPSASNELDCGRGISDEQLPRGVRRIARGASRRIERRFRGFARALPPLLSLPAIVPQNRALAWRYFPRHWSFPQASHNDHWYIQKLRHSIAHFAEFQGAFKRRKGQSGGAS